MTTLADLQNGQYVPGDTQSDPTQPPPWLDRQKFTRGCDFFKKHFVSILLAMYTSLACGLSVKQLLGPLIFTNRSSTARKAFKRYLSTFRHVVHWHLGNVWEPSDPAFQSVQNVRRMHGEVASTMKATDGNASRTIVSQYDMALVQCGFMGAVIMYPEHYGVSCTKDELECYIHFWRGIGYLLGMDDKYNICSGDYEDTKRLCKEIEKVIYESLRDPPVGFRHMAGVFIEGSNIPIPFTLFTFDSVFAWILTFWMDGSNKEFEKKMLNMSRFDAMRVKIYQLVCWMLRTLPCIERRINRWFIGNWYRYLKMDATQYQ